MLEVASLASVLFPERTSLLALYSVEANKKHNTSERGFVAATVAKDWV